MNTQNHISLLTLFPMNNMIAMKTKTNSQNYQKEYVCFVFNHKASFKETISGIWPHILWHALN